MDKFRKYIQKVFRTCLGLEFSRSSVEDIVEDILSSLIDYVINQEGKEIELSIGKLKVEENKLIYESYKDIEELKNEFYMGEEDDFNSEEINEIFNDDGDEFQPEENKIGNVDFSDEDDDILDYL